MTYSSLAIRLYPASTTNEQMQRSDTKSTCLANLDHLASHHRCGPYGVGDWAKSQGLPAYYVDNSWVRVQVSPTDLTKFADEVLQTSLPSTPLAKMPAW